MVEVRDLKVGFYRDNRISEAVRGVSFDIGESEIVGLVGESGSGKSVTASALLCLWQPPQAVVTGTVRIDGINAFSLKPDELPAYRSRCFGYISQEPSQSFDPLCTIGKNFLEMFRLKNPRIKRKESDARAVSLLSEAGISRPDERLNGFPHQFSGGMLQRIMIALALGGEGRLLIADEPTTALDVTVQAQIIRLLLDLKKKRGFSVLFISHNLDLVSAVSDRILVMYGGLIVESGTAAQVTKNPLSPYTRELLKSIPKPGMSYRDGPCRPIPGTAVNPLFPEPGCPFEPRCPHRRSECLLRVPPLRGKGHFYRCVLSETESADEGGVHVCQDRE